MTDKGKPFEGWAILELMGHRRLAGRLTEALVAGAAFIRIDVPGDCEGGDSARSCPQHGTCACPANRLGEAQPGINETCPLHGTGTNHGEPGSEWIVTQLYAPAAVYCITPTTEETARAGARAQRPTPVRLLDQRRQSDAPEDDDFDFDDEGGEA